MARKVVFSRGDGLTLKQFRKLTNDLPETTRIKFDDDGRSDEYLGLVSACVTSEGKHFEKLSRPVIVVAVN
jgi:hypothetical protein